MLNKILALSSSAFLLTSSAFLLSACSYSTFYVPVERLVYNPTSPASIAVSSQKTVKSPHKILGRVAAITWGGGDGARAQIQEEAAKLGANLIIDLRLERAFGRTSASGIAVMLLPESGGGPAGN
jgi:hypothetical protein